MSLGSIGMGSIHWVDTSLHAPLPRQRNHDAGNAGGGDMTGITVCALKRATMDRIAVTSLAPHALDRRCSSSPAPRPTIRLPSHHKQHAIKRLDGRATSNRWRARYMATEARRCSCGGDCAELQPWRCSCQACKHVARETAAACTVQAALRGVGSPISVPSERHQPPASLPQTWGARPLRL